MNEPFRAPQAVTMTGGRPNVPEPFNADYGPIRDEILTYIEENTDQKELAGGEAGQHFEW